MRNLWIFFVLIALASCGEMQVIEGDGGDISQSGYSASSAVLSSSDPLSVVFPHIGALNPTAGMAPAYMSGTEFTWFNHCRLTLDSTRANRQKLLTRNFDYYETARKPNVTQAELLRIQEDIRAITRDIDIATPPQCK